MGMTILIIDDEDNARENIGQFLTAKGYEVIGAATLAEGRASLQRGDADVVLLDVQLPDGYGPNLLYETAAMPLRPPIILITAYGDIDMAVDAMKNGAHDFLSKPIQLNQLEKSIERAGEVVALRREIEHIRQSQQQKGKFIVGKSQAMHQALDHAQKAAEKSVSVLITGETGSGKEVLANFIHANGPRASKPFIAINCAAIQNTMLEAELFGFEAGAFTGADKRKLGLMEVADQGILFLDEISSMPLDTQAKLLRVLEERAFRRVGGTSLIKIDVQIIAASNRPLSVMMKDGLFREDLYYRLKVVDIHVPPLRERKGDIPELVGFFIRLYNGRQGSNVTKISPRALAALSTYDWPGNIRELSNAIERAMLFCDGETIELSDLPADVANAEPKT
ncbi:MAG TPA: sigma-54 dependent transcriptional regulator [Longilinea sp.]|nr:sigma-54 dependent transcriptional regulator [Longilinea sp.]